MRMAWQAMALAGALAWASSLPAAADDAPVQLAADQALGETLDGRTLTLASLEGRPAVVLFWATWCAACAHELRMAEALHRKFGDRFTVLAISDEPRRDVKDFLRRNRTLSLQITRDPSHALTRRFLVQGIPTTLVVDGTGVVRWRRTGYDEAWLKELSVPLAAAVNAGAARARPAVAASPEAVDAVAP